MRPSRSLRPVTRTRLLVLGAVVGVVLQALLAHRTARPGGILEHRYVLLAEIGVWALVAALTVLCLLRLPRRTAVALLLVGAVSSGWRRSAPRHRCRTTCTATPGTASCRARASSPYRYVADVARRWPPCATSRAWSGSGRPSAGATADQTKINRSGVRTIYPPVAEAWFWVVHQVVPLQARDPGYEGAGMLLDLAVLAALLALLRSARPGPALGGRLRPHAAAGAGGGAERPRRRPRRAARGRRPGAGAARPAAARRPPSWPSPPS